MKRLASSTCSHTAKLLKKQKNTPDLIIPASTATAISTSPEPVTIQELLSARSLASTHLLAIAKLPLDVLSTYWIEGKNRPVNDSHVSKLYKSFASRGLGRQDQENYIKVTCSARAMDMVKAYYNNISDITGDLTIEPTRRWADGTDPASDPLDFREWTSATDELAELLDGQHRLKAAQQLLSEKDSSDRWWTCEIYNRGKFTS